MVDGPHTIAFFVLIPWCDPAISREVRIRFDEEESIVSLFVYRFGDLLPERVIVSPPCQVTYDYLREVTGGLVGAHAAGGE